MNWAKANYELATAQFELPIKTEKLKIYPNSSLEIIKDNYKIVEQGPKLNFWRAPIDNDMYILKDYKEKYFMHLMHEVVRDVKYSIKNNVLTFNVDVINGTTNSSWYYKSKYEYKVFGSGDILFKVSGIPSGKIENAPNMIPRIGVKMNINKDLEIVTYKGRGPGESYPDSKEANLFGVYESNIDKLFTNYVKPQENGNRSDCSWVSLRNDRGISLMAVANDKFDFSASYYEIKDLEYAKHTIDLVKRDYIVFNIDYKQNGLGSNSCGQWQLDKYRCKFEEFNLEFRLSIFNNKEVSEVSLGREIIKTH